MRRVLIPGLLLIAANAYSQINIANLSLPHLNEKALQNDALSKAGLSQFEDDITESQRLTEINLSEKDKHEAEVWQLTEAEEKRYIQLMQNKGHIYYNGLHLTPVDILGLNARSDDERDHFAELAAKLEAQKVAKNIAWNNAFHAAYKRLFDGVAVVGDFDPSPYSPYNQNPVTLQDGDNLYLFVQEDDPLKTILITLTKLLYKTPKARLHIMLVALADEPTSLWANQHQISPSLLANQQITITHGDLQYEALKSHSTPLLLLAKNGKSTVVDLGKF